MKRKSKTGFNIFIEHVPELNPKTGDIMFINTSGYSKCKKRVTGVSCQAIGEFINISEVRALISEINAIESESPVVMKVNSMIDSTKKQITWVTD